MANDLFSHLKAGLEYFYYGILSQSLVFHVHHCVMDIGVKGFALGGNLLHPQLFQHSLELGHGHLHALGIGLVGGLLLQRPLQIVIHRSSSLMVSALAVVQAFSFSFWLRLR